MVRVPGAGSGKIEMFHFTVPGSEDGNATDHDAPLPC
jgi:hypothetical protein